MGFQHPHQREHMMAGRRAAANSSKTPTHLRVHQKKLGGAMKQSSKMPPAQKQVGDVGKDSLQKLNGPQSSLYSGLYGELPK